MAPLSIKAALGSNLPEGGRQITLFIPSKDRSGQPIDQDAWTDRALAVLAELFRGATAFPPGKGVWRDDARGGALLKEITVMVVCFAPASKIKANLSQLREFLFALGREGRQGEVGVSIDGIYYGISNFGREES